MHRGLVSIAAIATTLAFAAPWDAIASQTLLIKAKNERLQSSPPAPKSAPAPVPAPRAKPAPAPSASRPAAVKPAAPPKTSQAAIPARPLSSPAQVKPAPAPAGRQAASTPKAASAPTAPKATAAGASTTSKPALPPAPKPIALPPAPVPKSAPAPAPAGTAAAAPRTTVAAAQAPRFTNLVFRHWHPRAVRLYEPPLIPLYTMAPPATYAPPATGTIGFPPTYGYVPPSYDLPVASPMSVTVQTGSLGPELPIALTVDQAQAAGPAAMIDYLQRTAADSAGQRACDFSAEGIRADGQQRPIAYARWRATPAHAQPEGGHASVYWVQLGVDPQHRCLAYRHVLETGKPAEPARDNVEDVLTALAALGVHPELSRQPARRTVQLDARRYLDLVDLL